MRTKYGPKHSVKNRQNFTANALLLATFLLYGCSSSNTDPTEASAPSPTVDPSESTDSSASDAIDDDTVDITETPAAPQIPLRELLPDVEFVFGQPIDEIPAPVAQLGDKELYWPYDIVNEQLSNSLYEAPLSHKLVWERYSNLIPFQYRKSLVQVGFQYASPTSNVFCNKTSAQVYSYDFGTQNADGEKTSLTICEDVTEHYFYSHSTDSATLDDFFDQYLWVHETAHILEASYSIELKEPNAEYYHTGLTGEPFPIGVHVAKDSLLGQYYEQFWLGELAEFYFSLNGNADQAAMMYQQFPDSFVSEYAATNFSEDFAETLTEFILAQEQPTPDDKMSTDKIRFLWTWPEMVSMRDDIRSRL